MIKFEVYIAVTVLLVTTLCLGLRVGEQQSRVRIGPWGQSLGHSWGLNWVQRWGRIFSRPRVRSNRKNAPMNEFE